MKFVNAQSAKNGRHIIVNVKQITFVDHQPEVISPNIDHCESERYDLFFTDNKAVSITKESFEANVLPTMLTA